jgi:hypothetical protein
MEQAGAVAVFGNDNSVELNVGANPKVVEIRRGFQKS